VKHYLADTRDRLRAAKRGAQHEHVPLVPGTDTSPGMECSIPEPAAPDAFFDRQWGLAVLELRARESREPSTFGREKPSNSNSSNRGSPATDQE
jgi:hypothetical protein